METGMIFANRFKILAAKESPEDALTAADYPVSGAYVDVSGYERVHVYVHLGAIDAGDTPNFHMKAAEAINGTLDTVSTTALSIEVANNDDDEFVTWTVETRKLPTDHHFLSLVVADVTNGAYADIVWWGEGLSLPVTQSASLLPTASQLEYVG